MLDVIVNSPLEGGNVSEDHIDEQYDGISRRRMLKRIGAGAAIAWTAPVLTSIRTPAFAQSPTCQGPDWNCGDPVPQCGSGPDDTVCVCDTDTEGAPLCWNDFFCDDPNAIACSSNADCEGTPFPHCATQCCGQTCVPDCANPGLQIRQRKTSKRASGR